jgi:hypothetical protein
MREPVEVTVTLGSVLWFLDLPVRYPLSRPRFKMTSAAITPGTHPQRVSKKTMTIEPHPWSITASGGKTIDRITRKIDIRLFSVTPKVRK